MIYDISLTVKPEDEKNSALIKKLAISQISKDFSAKIDKSESVNLVFIKKSIDARHGQIKIHLRYKVYVGESPENIYTNQLPQWKSVNSDKKVIIVGSGPAGLFGALKLLEYGIKPVIVERGKKTSERKIDIAQISTKNLVNDNSNYCFGEGGAGTFSDGKLYTRSNKRGNISSILQIFNYFGADSKILTDAHPHIGTDKLPKIINNMRQKILDLGGQFYFNTKCQDFIIENNTVKGIIAENLDDNTTFNLLADAVVLATGHSATDIYYHLAQKNPQALQAKTFAVGVRVEHPRSLIDSIQYHGKIDKNLPTAEYRVTTQVEGRGVYSFCMCPGGFVVPSASGPNQIVVNGMSSAARNSKWSNAAIVVEIQPQDIPSEYIQKAEQLGCPDIAGLLYRDELEALAYKNGNIQAAPAQRLTDFLDNKLSKDLPKSSYTPGLVSSNLNEWLPNHIKNRLQQGFKDINRNMKGFICSEALMIAIETRTSTPVRILRDKENLQCPDIKNLYPCGEGSGYSGGIVSSAMDGENSCKKLALSLINS